MSAQLGALDWLPPHPDLGRIYLPELFKTVSLPGRPTHHVNRLSEIGIVVATVKRPEYDDDGVLRRMRLIWHSITHNERVDVGADQQCFRVFGRTPAATNNGVLTVIAVATTGFTTKTKTDLSIGSASGGVTTNEFTTGGLSRGAGTLGTYTAPASLGAQFSLVNTRSFSSTATQTAHGSAVFDSATVVGSNMYVEDIFSADASLLSGDTLQVQWTVSN